MEGGLGTAWLPGRCATVLMIGLGALMFFGHCDVPGEDDRLPLTQFRRSVLDQQVRMLTLRYGEDHYVAYSLNDPPAVYKVWRGGVTWNGANYNSIKQIQPETYGIPYLEDVATNFYLQTKNAKQPIKLTYEGYKLGDNQLTLNYGIEGMDKVVIYERPGFRQTHDGLTFSRVLSVDGLTEGDLIFDSTLIGQYPIAIDFELDTLPAIPYPDGEVIAKTSHYWLAKTGCNTCHAMDYKMVGPSYKEISSAYDSDKKTIAELSKKVKEGGTGNWGTAIMVPHPHVAMADIERMVTDILSFLPKEEGKAKKKPRPRVVDAGEKSPGFGEALTGVHPAFTLQTIRPMWFKPQVGSMDFGTEGQLYVGTWDSIGAVYQLTGVETGDTQQIVVKQIASGLAEPLGMEVVGEQLYVMQKHELTRLIDHDGDEIIDEYKNIYNDFDVTSDFHEFAYDIEFVDGYFYGTLGIAMRLMTTERQLHDRGTAFKVDLDGDFKIVAEGLRQPNGIGRGINGALFTTENQGRWVPACKLIHIKEGDFHGCIQRQGERFADREVAPPALWLPQDEIGNSPSEPLLMQEGPYAGQMMFGEVSHGGINRAHLELVDGAYQGCVFRFCQGLEAGVNRIVRGPDNALYVGGVGMSGGWSHKGNLFGLQKLVFNENIPFEMLAINVTHEGFDIEFTKPLQADLKLSDLKLSLSQWHYRPTAAYGGPKLDQQKLTVSDFNLNEDRTQLSISVKNRKKGYVIYFLFDPSFKSSEGEKLWSGEAWYTLNAIPNKAI